LAWFKNDKRADEKPVYIWVGNRLLANLKAVRLIAPTFVLKNEAVHEGKLTSAKFKNAGLNARFVDYTAFLPVVQELKEDLNKPTTLEGTPKNIPFDQLASAANHLATYRTNGVASEKNLTEFFWFKGRFYVARQFLQPLLETIADRLKQPQPKMNNFELMEELATIYHRSELKNGYLKQNYLDMTVAITPEVVYNDDQREQIYDKTEAMNHARKDEYTDKVSEIKRHIYGLTYHEDRFCYALKRCGWFVVGEVIKPKMTLMAGDLRGKEMNVNVKIQVICPELKLHLTALTQKGSYQMRVPAQKAVQLVAVSPTRNTTEDKLNPQTTNILMGSQRVTSIMGKRLPELNLKPVTNIEASFAFAGM